MALRLQLFGDSQSGKHMAPGAACGKADETG
jgi:hypothetical protein